MSDNALSTLELSWQLTKHHDWAAVSLLMHPDALAQAKKLFRTIVLADSSGSVGDMFFGISSIESYDQLTDEEAYSALWNNLSTWVPGLSDAIKSAEVVTIGSVHEGDDLVHIVCRESAAAQSVSISKITVSTLKRHGDEWKLMLSANIEGIGARIQQLAGAIVRQPESAARH